MLTTPRTTAAGCPAGIAKRPWTKATTLIAEHDPTVLSLLIDELLAIASPA